jgi:hypothetical protein
MFYDRATEDNPSAEHVPVAEVGTAVLGGGIEGVQGFFYVPGLFPTFDYQSPGIASALVRNVPEPAISTFVLFGLAMLLSAKRSRRES